MAKVKIKQGFRFAGTYYGASARGRELPEDAEKFARDNGLLIAARPAVDAKSKGDAPENK